MQLLDIRIVKAGFGIRCLKSGAHDLNIRYDFREQKSMTDSPMGLGSRETEHIL
jgi:hypothetical protein